jgi:hypothetical protein
METIMVQKEKVNLDAKKEFQEVIKAAYKMSQDIGQEIEQAIQDAKKHPLTSDEIARLFTTVITVLKKSAKSRGDQKALRSLKGNIDDLVKKAITARAKSLRSPMNINASTKKSAKKKATKLSTRAKVRPLQVQLIARNGINPAPVYPRPFFHGTEIPMNGGFVKTTDVRLWSENERLEIHLGQFRQKYGRAPSSEELLDIMLSKMDLPGIPEDEKKDQFEIEQLARSIAGNGVRKPPIIDLDGTLLDGNRRLTACYYILNSDEFTSDEKARVEYIYVWQLTEHATDPERNLVVVSLNFEDDCKKEWPHYVKARKVYTEWQGMLALEQRVPSPQRQAQLKRELSKKFALGPDPSTVNRYIRMVDWANEFEDYHIGAKQRDEYETKHRADRYFQYFDELSKGTTSGGVSYVLNQDEGFKHLAFDLLFDGKFRNWRQIRELRFIADNPDARSALLKARKEEDVEMAEDHIENAMAIARHQRAENREVGANQRIETFVKWLEELPHRSFRDTVSASNLKRLLRALELVENHAKASLEHHEPKTAKQSSKKISK